jgi:hypothetical protein
MEMKKIAIAAALLTMIGSGAALAQGAPPGSASWHSGWPSFIESQRMNARRATTPRPDHRGAATENSGSVPVAGNAQNTYRSS